MSDELRPFEGDAITFRASGRALALQSLFFLLGAVIVGTVLGLRFDHVLLLAAFATLGQLALTWWIRIWTFGVRLDEHGIRRFDPQGEDAIAWEDVLSVDLAETIAEIRGRPIRLRYVVVEGRDGTRILFSDLSVVGSPRVRIDVGGPRPIMDVRDSGLLLALIADRVGDDRYLPDVLLEHIHPPAAPSGVPDDREADPPENRPRVSVAGFFVLLLKIGGKVAKGIPAALKTFKPGLALASGAAFSVVFSVEFALLLMLMLAFHEYGHVHAMRRSGLRVRGIYFIPLLGAAAVTEDTWRTRAQQAYIGLNGPIWGLALTAVAVVADAATGFEHPFVGVTIAWWALVNLFNLLPVNPLDGGRVLAAIGYSLSSRLGIVLSILMIGAALLLAVLLEISLFAIVGAIGLLEFISEATAAVQFRHIARSPRVSKLSAHGLATLKGLARPGLGEEADQTLFHMEVRHAMRLRKMAQVRPMSRGQAIRWGLTYLGTTAAFVALLVAAGAAHPDAAIARDIFR